MGFLSKLFAKVKPLSSGFSQVPQPRSLGLGGLFGGRQGLFNPFGRNLLSRGFMSNPLNLNNINILDKLRQSPTPLIPSLMPGMGDDQLTDQPLPGEMPSSMPSLDIMPRDAVLPKQPPQIGVAPAMTRGNAALLPPNIGPLPTKPMMGLGMGMPNFMSSGQMPKTAVGMYAEGGNAEKEYPNKGLAALAASGPGGKKAVKAMGFANGKEVVANPIPGIDMPSGSDADMMNYQNTLMALREMKASLPIDQQPFFDSAIREILGESGRTISNMDQMMIQDMMGGMPMPEMEKKKSESTNDVSLRDVTDLIFDPSDPLDYLALGLGPLAPLAKVKKIDKGQEFLDKVFGQNKALQKKLGPEGFKKHQKLKDLQTEKVSATQKLSDEINRLSDATGKVADRKRNSLIAQRQTIEGQIMDIDKEISELFK